MQLFMKYKNKGFTLIELIIVLSILGIVLASIYPLYQLGNRIYKKGTAQSDIQSDLRLASTIIGEKLKYAASLEIIASPYNSSDFGNPADTAYFGYDYIYIEDGKIKNKYYDMATHNYITKTLISGDDSTTLGLQFRDGGNNLIRVEMTADKGTNNYNVDTKIAIMNYSLGAVSMSNNGTAVRYKAAGLEAVANKAPTSDPVTITGIAKEGQTLTASYYYYDEDNDLEDLSNTKYEWHRVNTSNVDTIITSATAATYCLTNTDVGCKIYVRVTPYASTGMLQGTTGISGLTPIVVAIGVNAPPSIDINSISISGNPEKNSTISFTYTYYDAEGDSEGATKIQWYKSNSIVIDIEKEGIIIPENGLSYRCDKYDVGFYIYFTIKPITSAGDAGDTVKIGPLGPVVNK